MIRYTVSAYFILLFAINAIGQIGSYQTRFANSINESDLYQHLSILSADSLEGRKTGEKGQRMAGEYIGNYFKSLGLEGPIKEGKNKTFYQSFKLYSKIPSRAFLVINDTVYQNFKELVYLGSKEIKNIVDEHVLFLGAGSTEDFENSNIKEKGIAVIIDNYNQWIEVVQRAEEHGVKQVYLVFSGSDQSFARWGSLMHDLHQSTFKLEKIETKGADVFFLSPSLMGKMFNTHFETLKSEAENTNKKMRSAKISYSIPKSFEVLNTENVLGYLEGSDKKEELIIISAHYDHVGKDESGVYNGADDNGSGTSAILEIAQAFSIAKLNGNGPRRSILFMAFTGEEQGLLGSSYYVDNPVYPLRNTIVDLNVDMIGRIDSKFELTPEYVSLVGSDRLSTELYEISEQTNNKYCQLKLDYTYNNENHPQQIYYRSDHWNFAKKNIPVIFYFDGAHPDYHQTTDTVEKINFELLKKRTQLVFYTAWDLANRENQIIIDKISELDGER